MPVLLTHYYALALQSRYRAVNALRVAGDPELTPKDIAKRARAIENQVCLISANSGGIAGTGIPEASTDGMSSRSEATSSIL